MKLRLTKSVQINIFFYCMVSLSAARWHGKHTYLSSLGILGKKQLLSLAKTVTLKFKLTR